MMEGQPSSQPQPQSQKKFSPEEPKQKAPSGFLRGVLRSSQTLVKNMARLVTGTPKKKQVTLHEPEHVERSTDSNNNNLYNGKELTGFHVDEKDHTVTPIFRDAGLLKVSVPEGEPLNTATGELDLDLSEPEQVSVIQGGVQMFGDDRGPEARAGGYRPGDAVRGVVPAKPFRSLDDAMSGISQVAYSTRPLSEPVPRVTIPNRHDYQASAPIELVEEAEKDDLLKVVPISASGKSAGREGFRKDSVPTDSVDIDLTLPPEPANMQEVDIDLSALGVNVVTPPVRDENVALSPEAIQVRDEEIEKSSILARKELAAIKLPSSGLFGRLRELKDGVKTLLQKKKMKDEEYNKGFLDSEHEQDDTIGNDFKEIDQPEQAKVTERISSPDARADIALDVQRIAYYLQLLRRGVDPSLIDGPENVRAYQIAENIHLGRSLTEVTPVKKQETVQRQEKSPADKARERLLQARKSVHEVWKGFRPGPRLALSSGLLALGLLAPIGTINNGSLSAAAETAVQVVSQAAVHAPKIAGHSTLSPRTAKISIEHNDPSNGAVVDTYGDTAAWQTEKVVPPSVGSLSVPLVNEAAIRKGDTFTSIAVSLLVPEVFTPEVLEKISPELKKTFVANVINNLSPDQLKKIGIISGNADLIEAGKTIDIKLLAEMAKQMTVVVGGVKVPLVSQVSKMIQS
jgi:hypothetical protein